MEMFPRKMTFKNCVERIWEGYADEQLDWIMKQSIVMNALSQYFNDEDQLDVMEGFCRMLHHCESYEREFLQYNSHHLTSHVLDSFYGFITSSNLTEEEVDIILESPLPLEVHERALEVVTNLSRRHLEKVGRIFRLKDEEKKEYIARHILKLIETENVERAVEWICHFDLRKDPHFEEDSNQHVTIYKEIVCLLILKSRDDLLADFVGQDVYRQKDLIRYLDKLIGMLLSAFEGNTPLETRLLDTERKAEKATKRFYERYKSVIDESMLPNLLNLRCRDAVMYHHSRRERGELPQGDYKELILQALGKSEYVRNYYISVLSGKHAKVALYFAIYLKMDERNYPPDLKRFVDRYPGIVETTRVQVDKDKSERNWQRANEKDIDRLLFGKVPIILVDDVRGVRKVCQRIEDVLVVGVDTEWKPNFESMREQLAIMQIATSTEIFIVDVVVLEARLTEESWMQFFRTLLCSQTKKIGFAFHNDLRVMKSHFPFIAQLAPSIRNIICLRNLLTEVCDNLSVMELVFKGKQVNTLMENNLHEVARIFARINLNKEEREGNWMRRPLTNEQVEYAAMDAYCLIQCFDEISSRLALVDDKDIRRKLRDASRVLFKPESPSHEQKAVPKKGRETEEEFIDRIMATSKEIQEESNDENLTKRVVDVKFVVDSMFFGLGQRLRKCGFDVISIENRVQLVQFCLRNPEFTVISTGKAYKEIHIQLPKDRCICLVTNNDSIQLESRLIGQLCRQLKIVILPEDLYSRCSKCNQRPKFARIPWRIFTVLFLDFVVTSSCDWMLQGMSIESAKRELETATDQLYRNALRYGESINNDEEYTITVEGGIVTSQCRNCSIDLTNLLVLHNERVSPIRFKVPKSLKRIWMEQSPSCFEVCSSCGKVNKRAGD